MQINYVETRVVGEPSTESVNLYLFNLLKYYMYIAHPPVFDLLMLVACS